MAQRLLKNLIFGKFEKKKSHEGNLVYFLKHSLQCCENQKAALSQFIKNQNAKKRGINWEETNRKPSNLIDQAD